MPAAANVFVILSSAGRYVDVAPWTLEQVHIGMHVSGAGGGFFSNVWVWGADHSQWSGQSMSEDAAHIGFLGESAGPVWGIGVAAEHHRQAAFALRNAHNYQVRNRDGKQPQLVAVFVERMCA